MIKQNMKKKKVTKEGWRPDSSPRTDLERWLRKIVPKIVEVYGIGSITIYYQTNPDPRHMDRGEEVAFDIHFHKTYKSAYFGIYPLAETMFKNKQFKTLSSAITHEIAHIITSPFADLAMNRCVSKRELAETCEELTESVAQIGRQLVDRVYPDLFKLDNVPNKS